MTLVVDRRTVDYVSLTFVADAHRREGLALALKRHSIARRNPGRWFTIECHIQNLAILELNRSLGFVDISVLPVSLAQGLENVLNAA